MIDLLTSRKLWIGAEDGMWEHEFLALRRFYHRFGYKTDCGCGTRTLAGQCIEDVSPQYRYPKHVQHSWVLEPRTSACGVFEGSRSESGIPYVRYAQLHRDGFGRFTKVYRNGYFWRPDFDAYMDWYERHLAALAFHVLSCKASDDVRCPDWRCPSCYGPPMNVAVALWTSAITAAS